MSAPAVVRLRPMPLEVPAPRNGRPGYRWVPGWIVVNPDTGAEIHPPMRRREASAFVRNTWPGARLHFED